MNDSKISLHNAFRAARRYVNEAGFICIALDRSRAHGEITTSECDAAKDLVNKRLDGHSTLNKWCRHNIPDFEEDEEYDRLTACRMVQEFRVRWLNHLIKEFQ